MIMIIDNKKTPIILAEKLIWFKLMTARYRGSLKFGVCLLNYLLA